MKLKKIKNDSNADVELEHKNGAKTSLPPDASLKDVNITNLSEIQGNVKTVTDLTEVTESEGKTRLHG